MVAPINIPSTPNDVDLAIIGGGIIGICTAWYAAQQYPQWRIAVLEQSAIGSGATQYAASLDMPYGHTPLRHRLSARSRELYATLRKALPLPIKDLPFYGIVNKENAAPVLARLTDTNAKIEPGEIKKLNNTYPSLIIPDDKTIIAGGMASQAIINDSPKIIADHFVNQHHRIYEHTVVDSITSSNEQYHLHTATGNTFFAKRVVQATGPWIKNLLSTESKPSALPRVKKIIAFYIRQQPGPDDPVFYFFDDDAFLMPRYEAGHWLFSFKCDHWDVQPDITTLHIEETDKVKAHRILEKYYPSFVQFCHTGSVFCDAYTETGDPLIEPITTDSNYIFAGAGSGSGFRLAPAIAEEAISYFAP